MDKEQYLRQLYLVDREITEPRKEFINRWPQTPPFDSPENEKWYRDALTMERRFPEIEFGCFYSGDEGNDFLGRKAIWVDPGIRNKKGLDEYEGDEKEELLSGLRRKKDGLLFESVKLVIPIYPDTTKEDIEKLWPRITKLKKVVYEQVPKPKKDKWEENIAIYRFGQGKETVKEFTGKPGNPWENLANHLSITPQACQERYKSIKRFISFNVDKSEKRELIKEHLDCPTCEKNKECELFKTGKGECPFYEKLLKESGEGKVSLQSYNSVDQAEAKKAKEHGHWKAENEFLDSLDID